MLTVREIMTRPVVVIHSGATVADAIWTMRSQYVRSLIVEQDDPNASYGILTEKDIVYNVIAPGLDPNATKVSDIMRYPCAYLPPEATVKEAAQWLSAVGVHRAPVLEQNKLLGIISVTDILDKGSLPLPHSDKLSERIQSALQHARIIDDPEARTRQECDLAWQVLEDMDRSSMPAV